MSSWAEPLVQHEAWSTQVHHPSEDSGKSCVATGNILPAQDASRNLQGATAWSSVSQTQVECTPIQKMAELSTLSRQ